LKQTEKHRTHQTNKTTHKQASEQISKQAKTSKCKLIIYLKINEYIKQARIKNTETINPNKQTKKQANTDKQQNTL
jgi:hypothetical protein